MPTESPYFETSKKVYLRGKYMIHPSKLYNQFRDGEVEVVRFLDYEDCNYALKKIQDKIEVFYEINKMKEEVWVRFQYTDERFVYTDVPISLFSSHTTEC